MADKKSDIGLVGLAVMGQNLVLNMDDHGYTVAVYNRTTEKVTRFLANEAAGTKVIGSMSLEELVANLKRPRRVMIMVKAGGPVDAVIDQLIPARKRRHHYRWRQFALHRFDPPDQKG